jgi:glycosyltransferase involved in cell wall biosynthesis
MKVIIQLPCYNEEEALPATLATLPRTLAGVDVVEWLIVNDGSRDRTVEVALTHGVDHVVDLPLNMGLAHAFTAGLARSLAEGADIVVNTDADNQYDARDIPLLIAPILERRAEFVVGDRPIATIAHFSWIKRKLQHLGSWVVRVVSGTTVVDAPSGFRALSREAALRINVFDDYTYTIESIVQAGLSGMRITSVPIRVVGATRPSRLVTSVSGYVLRVGRSILRTFLIYKPGRSFFLLSLAPASFGLFLALRWLWLYFDGTPQSDGTVRTHVPSLVASAVLLIIAVLCWVAGLLGEQFAINRRLLQDIQYMVRREIRVRRGSDA